MAVSNGLQSETHAAVPDVKSVVPPDMNQMSYAEQYDYLASQPKGSVNFRKPCKKPSLDAQVTCDQQKSHHPFVLLDRILEADIAPSSLLCCLRVKLLIYSAVFQASASCSDCSDCKLRY